jgi:transcriptional regulator with XRE-family HTH domain
MSKNVSTPYRPDIALRIKDNIRQIWERVKHTRGLTQANLANALGLSQGAVSKLLSQENSHPWTIEKIATFADFCRVSVDELVGKDPFILSFFSGWTGADLTPSQHLLDESYSALERYFVSKGKTVSKARLESLAGMVAARVGSTERTAADFDRVIVDVILDEAGKSG